MSAFLSVVNMDTCCLDPPWEGLATKVAGSTDQGQLSAQPDVASASERVLT